MQNKPTKEPFVPPELPPEGLDYSKILEEILETREAVARFDESLERLPEPQIVQHAFETKEAVLSSRIEGTQVTLDEVFHFDAESEHEEKTEKEKDYQEVVNYRQAIAEGRKLLAQKPIGENVIKTLHRILLDSVRGHNRAPGKFRDKIVGIGPYGGTLEEAHFIPAPPEKVVSLMSNLEQYLHSDQAPDPIVQIAIGHYQFEVIHPFHDGNGRVGRILIPLFLYERSMTRLPNIYVSEFLEMHRDEYYDRLQAVSDSGEWMGWIKFFLRAVREQTRITGERALKAEELHKRLLNRSVEFNSIYAHAFIDAMFRSPVFTAQKIKGVADIKNQQTLYNLISKFLKAGIIEDMTPSRERKKIYAFTELIKIINQ